MVNTGFFCTLRVVKTIFGQEQQVFKYIVLFLKLSICDLYFYMMKYSCNL